MPRLWLGFYGRRWRRWSRIWMNPAGAAGLLLRPMSRGCAIISRICCRASAWILRPPLTLVQCCWPFRAWRGIEGVPLGQFHSDPHNLTQHLCLLRVPQDTNPNGRQGMRLQNNLLAAHAAPAAGMPLASFYKVDGTFVLRAPRAFHHFMPGFVDLDKAAGRQNRVHGEILGADVTISEFAVGKLRQVGDGDQSPLLH